MEIVGEVKTAEEFVAYVEALDTPAPLPTRVFVHHTWRPKREDWHGLDTIMAMKAYYEQQMWQDSEGAWHEGWTAGPHLFVAEDGIWLFSDLRYDGVGVYGQNCRARHLEMVGDYDNERPSGATLANTVVALGIMHERFGLDIRALNFHRDFATNSCPGRAVDKGWLIPLVEEWIANYRRSNEQRLPNLRRTLRRMIADLIAPENPQAALFKSAQARGLLGAITDEFPMEIEDQGYVVQLFAEALIVPVHQWDKVRSLQEYERGQEQGADESSRAPQLPTSLEDRPVVAPPRDHFQFDGRVRRRQGPDGHRR